MLKLNIPISYRNAGLFSTSLTLVYIFVDFVILFLSYLFLIFENIQNFFKYFYVFVLPRFVMTIVECKFKLVVYILNSNLKILNNYLEDISPTVNNTIDALKNCKNMFLKICQKWRYKEIK